MNDVVSKLFVRALAHKPYQNVASYWLEPNLMAQITLCHLPGPFWICHDIKIRQKKNTGFCHRWFFCQILTWKIWFWPHTKDFFMGKMAQFFFKNPKSPESYDNFQKAAKKIEGFYVFLSHLHSYYAAKYGKIVFWIIPTLATSQNPLKKPCSPVLRQ